MFPTARALCRHLLCHPGKYACSVCVTFAVLNTDAHADAAASAYRLPPLGSERAPLQPLLACVDNTAISQPAAYGLDGWLACHRRRSGRQPTQFLHCKWKGRTSFHAGLTPYLPGIQTIPWTLPSPASCILLSLWVNSTTLTGHLAGFGCLPGLSLGHAARFICMVVPSTKCLLLLSVPSSTCLWTLWAHFGTVLALFWYNSMWACRPACRMPPPGTFLILLPPPWWQGHSQFIPPDKFLPAPALPACLPSAMAGPMPAFLLPPGLPGTGTDDNSCCRGPGTDHPTFYHPHPSPTSPPPPSVLCHTPGGLPACFTASHAFFTCSTLYPPRHAL